MRQTQYGNNLWQLTQYRMANCYLVRDEDGLTLIDAGMSSSAKGIQAALDAIDLPLKRITLTHAHADHVGALEQIAALHPTAEVVLGERTAEFLREGPTLRADEPQDKLRGSYVRSSITPTRTVTDGDRIGSLQVIATPGHTPDHLSFLDERDQTLIVGDAFQTLGGIAVAGVTRWRFPLPSLATWQRTLAAESAARLLALSPSRLAAGHGRVLDNPSEAMRAAVQEASQSIETAADGG